MFQSFQFHWIVLGEWRENSTLQSLRSASRIRCMGMDTASPCMASGLIRKREDDDHNVVTRATATITTIHQPFQLSAGDEQDFILPSASHISSFKYLGATCWTNLQLYCYCDGDTLEKKAYCSLLQYIAFPLLSFLFLFPSLSITFFTAPEDNDIRLVDFHCNQPDSSHIGIVIILALRQTHPPHQTWEKIVSREKRL